MKLVGTMTMCLVIVPMAPTITVIGYKRLGDRHQPAVDDTSALSE